MNKYNRNLGHYFLKERLNEIYFDHNKIIEKEKSENVYEVSVVSKNTDELEEALELTKLYFVVNYPGLLIGTGTTVEFTPETKAKESLIKKLNFSNYKVGINFDYTSGLPYIPGSSLKGTIRDFFPKIEDEPEVREGKTEIINFFLNKNYTENDLIKLAQNIFEGAASVKEEKFLSISKRDKFIEGRITSEGKTFSVLDKDYITPHKNILDNPVPIQILKVRPGTKLEVLFELHDSYIDGISMSKKEKEILFEEILYITGLGAKTNTGYGHFDRSEAEELKKIKQREILEKEKELEKQKAEEEKRLLEEKKANMTELEKFEFEFSLMNKEEKKGSYKLENIEKFENIEDRKKIAKLYYDFFINEKQNDKTKKKVQQLKNILES